MEINKIYVYGASGHGKVVASVAKVCGYEVVGFLDDDLDKKEYFNLPVISFEQYIKMLDGSLIALGIGNNQARKNIFKKIKQHQLRLVSLTHPSAIVASSASVGAGSVVMPNVVINADAIIGSGAIINSASVIEHDCVLEDFVHISPNAALAGGVRVGSLSWIGMGASVIQQIKIGSSCIIGAGAAVICDIPDNVTAVGVPAKIKEQR